MRPMTARGAVRRRALAAGLILLADAWIVRAPVVAGQVEDAAALVRGLSSVGGVAGHEGQVRAAIRKAAPSWASFEEDGPGNLTVTVGSGGTGLLLVAHMDEPGYVVTGITDRGYLKLQRLSRQPLSPLFDQFHLGQPLQVQSRRAVVPAVAVVPSTHLWRGNAAPLNRPIVDEDLFVDIGARTPDDVAAAGVALLDPVVIARRIVDLAAGRIAGPAMDDRAGCAALLGLLQTLEPSKLRGTLTVAFSAQELMGGRGAERLRNRLHLGDVLVIDAPAAGRTAAVPGGGPAVSAPGGKEGYSQRLYNLVAEQAAELQIPLQNVPFTPGGDQSAFQGRAQLLAVGVPVLYAGTPGEVADAHDVVALARLLKAIAEAER